MKKSTYKSRAKLLVEVHKLNKDLQRSKAAFNVLNESYDDQKGLIGKQKSEIGKLEKQCHEALDQRDKSDQTRGKLNATIRANEHELEKLYDETNLANKKLNKAMVIIESVADIMYPDLALEPVQSYNTHGQLTQMPDNVLNVNQRMLRHLYRLFKG